MTVAEFFGCAFMAFGPALAMFCFTIAIDPIRVIVLLASSFFWLLSLLFSSIVWILIPIPEHLILGMVFSVIYQEVFRVIVYRVLRKAEVGLKKITDNETELTGNKHILAYVAGLGFGLMSGLFALINVLADSVGPGTMGLLRGSPDFFMTSAAFTLIFTLLHTFWGVISFDALDNGKHFNLALVILSHFGASGLTFLNSKQLYALSLIPCCLILILNAFVAFSVAGGTVNSFKQCVTLRRTI